MVFLTFRPLETQEYQPWAIPIAFARTCVWGIMRCTLIWVWLVIISGSSWLRTWGGRPCPCLKSRRRPLARLVGCCRLLVLHACCCRCSCSCSTYSPCRRTFSIAGSCRWGSWGFWWGLIIAGFRLFSKPQGISCPWGRLCCWVTWRRILLCGCRCSRCFWTCCRPFGLECWRRVTSSCWRSKTWWKIYPRACPRWWRAWHVHGVSTRSIL